MHKDVSQEPKLLVLGCSETLAAKYGSVACGLERNLSVFSALSASYSEVLSLGLCCVLSLVTACLASLRLILEALLCVKLLLACREYKFLTAILAY